MKRLLALSLLLSGPTYGANDAATAFATGFANAMNQRMGGVPYTPPQQTQQVVVVQPVQRSEIRAIREDGSIGPVFMNYSGCWKFVNKTFGFASCGNVIVDF